ncbi:MAG: DUF1698 domain-containing protein [Flavobacteriaceae bacterium]
MNKSQIQKFYSNTSKHSNYQKLHPIVEKVVDSNGLLINSRHEKERIDFVKDKISFKNKKIADIGGNTGYFSFDSLFEGAKFVDFYEGNEAHSLLVNKLSEYLNLDIRVYNKYLNFDNMNLPNQYDLIFNFNVMHHIGDDFGDKNISMENALKSISNGLKELSKHTKWMIFQIGFCWKGDIKKGFFTNGTKEEMIHFIENCTRNYWDIESIGIPELYNDTVVYKEMNSNNLLRNDGIGEFLNRPLFILKSKIN